MGSRREEHVPIPGPLADHLAAIGRGEKKLPNCEGTRHHYVSEFILRRFCGPGRKLFELDKTDGSCVAKTPGEIGWEANLYAVQSVSGNDDGIVEGLFGLAENYAADSVRELLRNPNGVAEADRANIAFLLAIQEQRTPGYIAEAEELLAQMGTMYAAVDLANRDGPARLRRQAMESYHALVEGRVLLRPTREHVLKATLESLDHLVHVIRSLPWTLLRSTSDQFVCSDRPLTMHDPLPPHEWSGPGWLSSDFVTATMPLSPTACLRVSPADHRHFSVRPVERQVSKINLRTYAWATRYVYGPSQQALTGLHAYALAHPEDIPVVKRRRTVIVEDASSADPQVAARNVARGWNANLVQRDADGTFRLMSYEVIDSLDDARRAVAPRPGDAVEGR